MKKYGTIILILLFFLQLLPVMGHADTAATGGCSSLFADQNLSGNTAYNGTAKAVILYERNTQTMVYSHNPDEKINPTGLVKLLTALIVLEEGNLDDVVTVKRSTLNSISPGSVSAGLKAGEQIKLEDLLYCVMVSSANDAAAVAAEHVAGSQSAFVEKMNARAATLGCANTHFANVHGLQDERQYSTARDMAIIVADALKNEDFVYYFGVTEHTVSATNSSSARRLSTTNYMMDPDRNYYDSRVTGGKPAAATSADRSMICTAKVEGSEYLCVVISAKAKMSGNAVTRYTNFDEAADLLDFGFQGYAIQQVVGTQQPFGMYPVSGGKNHVVVAPSREMYALLPVNFNADQLQLRDVRDEASLVAPLDAGAAVGKLQIYFGSLFIGEVELVARHGVEDFGASTVSGDSDSSNGGDIVGTILKVALPIVLVVSLFPVVAVWRKRKGAQKRKSSINERGAR